MKKILFAVFCLLGLSASAQTTWSYGDHSYTMKGNLTAEVYNQKATGVVTFSNVPKNYEEFEALYTEFLGKTPHGTAAMMPMAMEIYGRDRDEGLRCIQLICWPSNVTCERSASLPTISTALSTRFESSFVTRSPPARPPPWMIT